MLGAWQEIQQESEGEVKSRVPYGELGRYPTVSAQPLGGHSQGNAPASLQFGKTSLIKIWKTFLKRISLGTGILVNDLLELSW